MYQALYRKWRPRTFDDVVGQPHITETLKRQVAAGRLSHAYLFTGTRGTGKTTCAKILARAVNCENPVDGNPCNRCPACLGIESGAVLDVLELDAASNNGVDQIRALRDEAIYTPAAVRKRVYIVDEVHMLSTPAFNALLKILEEPPAHLMFILATTELHKVPATIKSRCQQFAFKRISPKAIADRLAYVAEQEGLTLTAPAAALLARLADGGLRDGLSLLDQCSGGGGEITEETVLSVLGLAGSRRTAQILDSVSRRDTAGALQGLDELYRDGKDMGALLGELSSLVRDLLIRKTAPEGGQGLLTGGYEEKTLRALAEGFTAAELVQMMGILQKAQADLYRSSSRRLDAELCLIRLCDRHLAEDVEGLTARISRLEEQLARGVPAAPAAQPAQPVRGPEPPAPVSEEPPPPWEEEPPPLVDQDLPPWDVEPAPPAAPVRPAPPKPQPQPSPAPAQSSPPPAQGNSWNGFLAGLKDLPPMAQSFLRKPDTVTGVFDETSLTLWVDSDLTKGVLSRGDTLKRLEQAAEGYTGQPHRVFVKVGKPQPPEPSAPAEDKFNDLLALGRQFGNFTVK
ncbi:MAG: DNA polymerase III subunit gamma/tau [Clostridiales bacterium]|uniref:DNA polymerase III subunit gamma/tau n=1 Tax=Evtepia sp. TaxID=2773933 RepID=UPI0029839318|nr:DNA polymerase III subunit gamma/tau [Evtepia sp.]MDD7288619.1 DNA polymerase III subunit gamma/tau [Clostridiales bacterium]MDY3992077.1 DNA polymerase III subunit gamma/tau [Evtepia sp.]MDY4430053.1 DNA polymerase III subunit gamma/tau [Evtepia sp.]